MFSRLRSSVKGALASRLGGKAAEPEVRPAAPVRAAPPVVVPAPVRAAPPVVVPAPVVEAPAVAAPPVAVPEPVVEAPPLAARRPSSLAAAAAAAAARSSEPLLHADMGSTDREHYIARAKANNRDVGSITGTEGLNRADDGEAFWGPVNNESSRAKADGQVLTIDQWECISCGTCVEQTNKVFFLPDDAKATPIAQDGPMDLIQDAIEACPVTCIHWLPVAEAADKGFATGNEPDSPRPE